MGGGVAGLSSALALARTGRTVVLLERDDGRPAGESADDVFDGWQRPGVPHFRQPHNFWALARELLLEHAPDVLAAVVELGALENRQYELLPGDPEDADASLVSLCVRRPVFELALRRALEREPAVTIEGGTRAAGLLADEADSNGVRVIGAVTDRGDEVRAGLVVDALGRSSPVVSWLEELGAPAPPERRSPCGLLYYSRHFRFRPGVEMPVVPSLTRGPRGDMGYLGFAVFVEDNRTFSLVLTIATWERELRALRREAAYTAAALAIPSLVPWVHPDQVEPITPVLPMGSLQNMHRSLVVDGVPVATGVQPIGDALCHTNPTFAFGAPMALRHAFALAATAGDGDPRAVALAFDEAVDADAASRYEAVSSDDLDRDRLWRGEPVDVGPAFFVRTTVYPLAGEDAGLFRAVARRVNLLDPVDALERDEELVERARRLAAAADPPAPAGPPRERLLELIAE